MLLLGWHRHSVAYHSHTGAVHASDPLVGRPYGPPYKEGDVIGVGYLSNTSTVFFTRNGKVKRLILLIATTILGAYLTDLHNIPESWQSFHWVQIPCVSCGRRKRSVPSVSEFWSTR